MALALKKKRRVTPLPDEVEGVTIVRDKAGAKKALALLMDIRDRLHANDVESADIDVKKQSPITHGTVICFSIYCGDDIDFGNGPKLWVDTLEQPETILHFEPYFSAEFILKLWHNYGFDRHQIRRRGIDVQGLGADTLHKARLWDASRDSMSLESLTEDLLGHRKVPMRERFSVPKLKKDGTPGKTMILPSMRELQLGPKTRLDWIDYSTFDTQGTWGVNEELDKKLLEMPWVGEKTMLDFYQEQWLPLGTILTRMERRGIYVDEQYLQEILPIAVKGKEEAEEIFKKWASKHCPDAMMMNTGSDKQVQTLLFAPFRHKKTGEQLTREKEFKVPNVWGYIKPSKAKNPKKPPKPTKTWPIVLKGMGWPALNITKSGWPSVDGDTLTLLSGKLDEKEPQWGRAYELVGGGKEGENACKAIWALREANAIGTLLSNFITTLPVMRDKQGRVHTTLNTETETGRLSSRKPNLQNQPALEKDRFFIRDCFQASPPGKLPWQRMAPVDQKNCLISADYKQLELRILAHLANCPSMINAIHAGGDFHSRTAVGMYPYIQEAIDRGECTVDSNDQGLPLVKDLFGAERRNGKTINFGIAYGKTPFGLAAELFISQEEAQEILDTWYADRPEVKEWQRITTAKAYRNGYVRTLGGRYRPIPDLYHKWRGIRSHGERVAINTPVQGGAADIVVAAMILIEANEELRALDWRMLLQIHDELIFEGPRKHAERAKQIIMEVMSNPFKKPLRVRLEVDATIEQSWYLCK